MTDTVISLNVYLKLLDVLEEAGYILIDADIHNALLESVAHFREAIEKKRGVHDQTDLGEFSTVTGREEPAKTCGTCTSFIPDVMSPEPLGTCVAYDEDRHRENANTEHAMCDDYEPRSKSCAGCLYFHPEDDGCNCYKWGIKVSGDKSDCIYYREPTPVEEPKQQEPETLQAEIHEDEEERSCHNCEHHSRNTDGERICTKIGNDPNDPVVLMESVDVGVLCTSYKPKAETEQEPENKCIKCKSYKITDSWEKYCTNLNAFLKDGYVRDCEDFEPITTQDEETNKRRTRLAELMHEGPVCPEDCTTCTEEDCNGRQPQPEEEEHVENIEEFKPKNTCQCKYCYKFQPEPNELDAGFGWCNGSKGVSSANGEDIVEDCTEYKPLIIVPPERTNQVVIDSGDRWAISVEHRTWVQIEDGSATYALLQNTSSNDIRKGNKVYIYEKQGKGGCGKMVGEFRIASVETHDKNELVGVTWQDNLGRTSTDINDAVKFLTARVIGISDLEVYEEPVALREGRTAPRGCNFAYYWTEIEEDKQK